MKKDDAVTSCFGIVFGIIAVAIVSALANGWALSTIWNWFIPPLFHLTTLTYFQAIGVATVFSLFTGTKSSKDDDKSDSVGEAILKALLVPVFTALFTVGFAWIILQFAF